MKKIKKGFFIGFMKKYRTFLSVTETVEEAGQLPEPRQGVPVHIVHDAPGRRRSRTADLRDREETRHCLPEGFPLHGQAEALR